MTEAQLSPVTPYNLLRIGEAWRNRPGITTLLIAFVAAALAFVLGVQGGGWTTLTLSALLGLLCLFAGFSAAGVQFMDQAAGRPITGTAAALLGSPLVLARTLGLALLLIVAFAAYLAIAYLVLLICKIPALGALLYMLAVPVMTFIGALLFLGMVMTALISGAALWEGHSFSAALSLGWGVATERPIQGFLNVIVLVFVSSLVALIVSVFMISAFSTVAGLSVAVFGSDMAMGASTLFGSTRGGRFGPVDAGGALVFAGAIGTAIVFATTQALFAATSLLGIALTYLNLTAGLDASVTQAAVESAIAKTKEKAQQAAAEAKRRAQDAQQAAKARMEQAKEAQVVRSAPVASPLLTCLKCQAPIQADDLFCGSCGHRAG